MIKPEELALIKGYTVTKEGILLNRITINLMVDFNKQIKKQ